MHSNLNFHGNHVAGIRNLSSYPVQTFRASIRLTPTGFPMSDRTTVQESVHPPQAPTSANQPGWRDWIEVAVAYGLILATIWTPRPAQQWLYLAATAWVITTTWISFPGWSALGVRRGGLRQSSWVMGAALVLVLAGIQIAAMLHTLRGPLAARGLVMTFGGYAVFSFAQQFLMQSYFLLRFRRVLGNDASAVTAAVATFSLAHLPNPILTGLTVIWGLCASLIFVRWRNLLPLGVAHAMLGIGVALTVPGPVIHNMRVGLGYVQYHPHRHGPRLLTAQQGPYPAGTATGSAIQKAIHPH